MGGDLLLDTVALWGLVFINSKYHRPVARLVRGRRVIVHAICLHEMVYPAYKLESRGGRDLDAGMRVIGSLRRSYANLAQNYGFLYGVERLTILPLTLDDLLEAYRLVLEERDIFVEERDGYWPSVVDAVVAHVWRRLGAELITSDEKLMAYGDRHGLPYRRIAPAEGD